MLILSITTKGSNYSFNLDDQLSLRLSHFSSHPLTVNGKDVMSFFNEKLAQSELMEIFKKSFLEMNRNGTLSEEEIKGAIEFIKKFECGGTQVKYLALISSTVLRSSSTQDPRTNEHKKWIVRSYRAVLRNTKYIDTDWSIELAIDGIRNDLIALEHLYQLKRTA